MTNELEQCPFCGSQAKVTKHIWSGHKDLFGLNVSDREKTIPDMFQVVCCGQNEKCILSQEHYGWHKTEEGAINAWNTRYKRTCNVDGEWKPVSQTQEVRLETCSNCGHEFGASKRNHSPWETEWLTEFPKFCPNCGAEVVDE